MSEHQRPLVFIFGPAAVGKMTVGQELANLTGFKLLYNHMVVDLVTAFFPFGSKPFHALARPITQQLIEACAKNGLGLIITHGLLFSGPDGASAGARELIDEWSGPYRETGAQIFFVELAAPLAVRLQRNATENRARHKKVDWATPERLREMEGWGKWHSNSDMLDPSRHVMIENSAMSAIDAALLVKESFEL